MTTTAEPTDSSAAPADEHLAVLMADRATLGATLDRFAAAFTALAALLGAAPDAELVDRVRAGDQLAQRSTSSSSASPCSCAPRTPSSAWLRRA